MEALRGTIADRAGATLAAGCDLALHCNGKMEEMLTLQAVVPEISPATKKRLSCKRPKAAPGDPQMLLARLGALMAGNV